MVNLTPIPAPVGVDGGVHDHLNPMHPPGNEFVGQGSPGPGNAPPKSAEPGQQEARGCQKRIRQMGICVNAREQRKTGEDQRKERREPKRRGPTLVAARGGIFWSRPHVGFPCPL